MIPSQAQVGDGEHWTLTATAGAVEPLGWVVVVRGRAAVAPIRWGPPPPALIEY